MADPLLDFPDKVAVSDPLADFPDRALANPRTAWTDYIASQPVTKPGAVPVTPSWLPPMPDPLRVAGQGMSFALRPLTKAFELAGQADVAAGNKGWPWEGPKTPESAANRAQAYTNVVPPLVTALASGGQSILPQALAQMGTTKAMQEGGMEPQSTPQVIASGAIPMALAGVGRLIRGGGRTLTRVLPGQFQAAQQGAQTAAGEVGQALRPETAASNLFKSARAAGGEVIPAGNIQRVAADVAESIGENPQTPGLQVARAFADKLTAATANGSLDLKALMQLRRDLGMSIGRAPEVAGLYGAVLSDLEAAAAAGGPGANMATSALQAFKQDLGANRFAAMVDAATKDTVAGGRGLNIATLRKAVTAVPKNGAEPELLRLLGPEKYQNVLQFLDEYRALPPAMAYTFADFLKRGLSSVAGGVAGLATGVGGPIGSIAGWVIPELLQNARLVGHNPPGLNAFFSALGGMGRAAMAAPKQGAP